jgi:5-methyltetrahydropteroyltriglutamate--homocysteine methyltransferase
MIENRIGVTHVGSLIRPPALIEFLKAIEGGQPYDAAGYERCLASSIAEIVRQQTEAGIDIVSDGEFSKGKNWAFYIHDRLSGVARRPLTEAEAKDPRLVTPVGGRDRESFPEFYAEYDKATGLAGRLAFRAVCNGPIRYTGQAQIARDIANLKAATGKTRVAGAFLPVVAPASAFPEVENQHYADEEAFLFGLAEALGVEYRAIVDAGLTVQIDDAFLPFMYERLVPPMTLTQYRKWAALRVAALNRALEGIPPERARYHICWGSWNGPHVHDVPMKDIVDLVLKVRVGAYLFEAANPRHEHEWRVWESVKLPRDKVLIPGVISHATNIVEHPELVAQRLVRLARVVGRERVMAGTDCGFAQSPFARRVHPTIMWAKLRALAEGARLASAELWGRRRAKKPASRPRRLSTRAARRR